MLCKNFSLSFYEFLFWQIERVRKEWEIKGRYGHKDLLSERYDKELIDKIGDKYRKRKPPTLDLREVGQRGGEKVGRKVNWERVSFNIVVETYLVKHYKYNGNT